MKFPFVLTFYPRIKWQGAFLIPNCNELVIIDLISQSQSSSNQALAHVGLLSTFVTQFENLIFWGLRNEYHCTFWGLEIAMFSIIALCSNVSSGTIRRPRFILIIFTSTKPDVQITDAREAIILMNSRLASTSSFSEILILTKLSRLVVFVANKATIGRS